MSAGQVWIRQHLARCIELRCRRPTAGESVQVLLQSICEGKPGHIGVECLGTPGGDDTVSVLDSLLVFRFLLLMMWMLRPLLALGLGVQGLGRVVQGVEDHVILETLVVDNVDSVVDHVLFILTTGFFILACAVTTTLAFHAHDGQHRYHH